MKLYFIGFLIFTQYLSVRAQHGLEGITVEKYYVSNTKDEKKSKKTLRAGSVTYRIYVDLLYGYRFQAAYGVAGHPLRISTTTYFFNNEESGGAIANDISDKQLNSNTVMVDSWLSVGAGSEASFAVLKTADTSLAIKNKNKLLQNEDPSAGIPLKVRDGLIPKPPMPMVAFYGIDSTQMNFLKKNSPETKGQTFTTEDGSWASFGGVIGLDSANRVLIAQFTTDGQLSFELNLQIAKPGGGVENYVSKNPTGAEILFPGLVYLSPNSVSEKKK